MSELNEDFLSVDNRIPGQNFCCISFLSPEKVMKNKEVFFVTKFLNMFLILKTEFIQMFEKKCKILKILHIITLMNYIMIGNLIKIMIWN